MPRRVDAVPGEPERDQVSKKKSIQPDWPDLIAEPEGWRGLRRRAPSERDPKKLEEIIAEMNRLLRVREKSGRR